MRTRTLVIFTAAAAASLAACKWTDFDDLENETWVDSTGKPDVKSSNYGVVLQRGADAAESTSGGTLAVIGAGPGSYSELTYDPAGSAKLDTNSRLQLAAQGIMALDSPPIFLASPASSEVALVTTGDTSSIVVATGTHTLLVRQLFVNNTTLGSAVAIGSTPDAATYVQPLPLTGGDPNPGPAPIVAVGDVVMGTIYAPPANSKQPACRLTDGTTPVQVRALGAVSSGATDDILVWNSDGKLLRYPGTVFNGCATPTPPIMASTASPAFAPARGSQILTIDATHVLLQGHEDLMKGNASFLQVYDTTTLMPVGMPITAEGLRAAAILDTGSAKYVVAGYPTTIIDGKTAGEVLLFKLAAGGIESATPSLMLHDAQPENNQLFGRSVTAMPYNGKQVLAVAADNEVFVYFRANLADGTPLYDETRQGR